MKRFKNIFAIALAVVGLTSCLDEEEIFNPDASENVIEFASNTPIKSALGAVYPLYVNSFELEPEVELPVVISYSGGDVAPSDIVVEVSLDPEALDVYNEWNNVTNDPDDHEADYMLLPTDLYNIPSTTVTIPKGERTATMMVKLNPAQFDLTMKYALPLTITEVSSGMVSGNHSTAIFAVGAKNKYDGVYTVTGSAEDYVAALSEYYPKNDIHLVTVDANTVEYYDADFGLSGIIMTNDATGGATYYGNFAPQFNFDAENNVESVTNAYGQGTNPSNRSAQLVPTGVNKFTFAEDGTPETLEVHYYMMQAGGIRTEFIETYTYVGSR